MTSRKLRLKVRVGGKLNDTRQVRLDFVFTTDQQYSRLGDSQLAGHRAAKSALFFRASEINILCKTNPFAINLWHIRTDRGAIVMGSLKEGVVKQGWARAEIPTNRVLRMLR